jgi:two-component system LytT family response regulator
MKISCIIIDDEPNSLKLLELYVSKTNSLELKGKFYDGIEAFPFLQQQRVDVIFTDIDMPGISGLELADAVPQEQQIVFITGSKKYAFHTFRCQVIDYLLKPVSYERFSQAVAKISAGIGE